MLISLADAQTHLAQIIDRVQNGEKVTIVQNNLPLVDMIPHQKQAARRLGFAKELITFSDDIFAPDDALTALFYQSGIEP